MGNFLDSTEAASISASVTTNRIKNGYLSRCLQSPKRSLQQMYLKLNLSQTSMKRMFRYIDDFAFRIQTRQHLGNADKVTRIVYCASMLEVVYNDPLFLSKV